MEKLLLAAILAASVAPLSAKVGGGYVGASIGESFTKVKSDKNKENGKTTRNARVGAHLGWDHVFSNNVLVGAESAFGLKGLSVGLHGKMGYVISDNVVIGVLTGWKSTKFTNTYPVKIKFRANGLTTGAYIATMLTENVELAGQYTHEFYKKKNVLKRKLKVSDNIFRLKLSYKI